LSYDKDKFNNALFSRIKGNQKLKLGLIERDAAGLDDNTDGFIYALVDTIFTTPIMLLTMVCMLLASIEFII
jgi:hypothetical protein